MAQYTHTIGYTPTSYVVMKYLDPHRHISNLVGYLEALKGKGVMSDVHLSLLLTCYVRLEDEGRVAELLSDVYALVLPSASGSWSDDKSGE
jgi:hypothetical protein